MPDTLPAQEKKAPSKVENYDEKVTIRQWSGGKFIKAVEAPAFRGEIKDKKVFYVMNPPGTESPPKSEIIDKDGTVWVVDKVTKASTFHINYVTKKPAEKKP